MLMALPASAARRLPRQVAAQTSDGQAVVLTLVTGEKVKGRLLRATDESVTVIPNDSSAGMQPREFKYSEIESLKRRPAIGRNILAGFGVVFVFFMAFGGLINR